MNWAGVLRTALALGIPPGDLWRLSVREWRMLTADAQGRVPPGRRELEKLMEAYPDD